MTDVAEHLDVQPRPYRLSRSLYNRMAQLGFFFGQRVELLNGKVYAMAPQGDRHEASVGLTLRRLMKAFGDEYWVRPQMSLELKPRSVPEPDIAVVHGPPGQSIGKPTSALLIVEVSDSTLRFDQRRKSSLYARNGIADFWIVNLVENQLEIHRSPIEDSSTPFGFRYSAVTRLRATDAVAPLALPDVRIAAAELIPLGA